MTIHYSIIIPAYNAEHTISDCVTACQQQTGVDRATYEIIVVDNGSTDATAVVAQKAGADHVLTHDKVQGAAAARNRGLSLAQGSITLFTDADCMPQPDWLSKMVKPFSDPDLVGCKGIYATYQPQIVARFVQIEYEDKYDLMRQEETIDFIDTYSAAYRRDILIEMGGFNEHIFYAEDLELSFRLDAQQCKMIFQPQAVVAHLHSDSLVSYTLKKYHNGYWRAQVIHRHPEKVIKDSHTPQVSKVQMVLMAGMLASGGIGLFIPPLWVFTLLLFVIFQATAVPFIRKAWGKDRPVALASPFLLMVRATALGFGYALGMLYKRV